MPRDGLRLLLAELQRDLERGARLAGDQPRSRLDVAFFVHDAGYLDKLLARRHGNRRLASRVSVTHTRKHICNGVGQWSFVSFSFGSLMNHIGSVRDKRP